MTAAQHQEGAAMKALAIHGKEDIRWEDRPLPEPGEGEVRLRVRFVGICGSDLHYYFHGVNGEYAIKEPLTPGHELSAVVDLDPSGRLEPGTPVTVHPARYGAPVPGLEDHPHLRPGGDYFGSAATTPHRQGGAAEYLVVEDHMIRVLPEALPLERAALAEPLAVALHAVNLAGDDEGLRGTALTKRRGRGAAEVVAAGPQVRKVLESRDRRAVAGGMHSDRGSGLESPGRVEVDDCRQLVPRDERLLDRVFAVDAVEVVVQVGPADADEPDAQAHLALTGLGKRAVLPADVFLAVDRERLHGASFLLVCRGHAETS